MSEVHNAAVDMIGEKNEQLRLHKLVDSERAAVEAMLRSSGLEIIEHPEPETWICEPRRARNADGTF